MGFVPDINVKRISRVGILIVLTLIFHSFSITSAGNIRKEGLTVDKLNHLFLNIAGTDTILMTEGEIGFDYKPYFSNDTHHYMVSGSWDTSLVLTDSVEMVGGVVISSLDSSLLGFFGLHYFPSEGELTADLVAYFLASDSAIDTGTYSLDISSASNPSIFLFLLGLDSIAVPSSIDSLNFTNFMDYISADTMIIGTEGEFTFDVIEDTLISGIFNADGADAMNPMFYSVSNGYFRLTTPLFPLKLNSQAIEMPAKFRVSNYPNPFNASTTFEISIPREISDVVVEFYDIKGFRVDSYSYSDLSDRLNFKWDPSGISSGVYFYKISTYNSDKYMGSFSGKILLVK